MKALPHSSPEPLESRIAPSVIFTLADVDGDAVVVTISKGNQSDADLIFSPDGPFAGLAAGNYEQIKLLGNPVFNGANITITAKRQDIDGNGTLEGDGHVNVGFIDATGIDLGKVKVDGDLGEIKAGNPANPAVACKGLTALSIGRYGVATGATSLQSDLDGGLNKLTVKSDVTSVLFRVFDNSSGGNGKIGSIVIGGSLIGTPVNGSGQILALDEIGPVVIKGDIAGGKGQGSGVLFCLGSIDSVTVGGSLTGGSNANTGIAVTSGLIHAGTHIGTVRIGGSVTGGTGNNSGAIDSGGTLGAVKIGGSVNGGSGIESGRIFASGTLASAEVGGSLRGIQFNSGQIRSNGAMGPVRIGGDIEGGFAVSAGGIFAGTLASVKIGGSILGGSDILAGAISTAGAMGPVTIVGSIEGGGGVSFSGLVSSGSTMAAITLGGSLVGGTASGSGRIGSTGVMGPVKIGGDIVGSDVTSASTLSNTATINAQRIASLSVGGSIIAGTASGGGTVTDSGAIHAVDDIGAIKVKGSLIGNVSNPVVITARGQASVSPTDISDIAIKRITIGGRAERAQILAGYDRNLVGLNGDAQIGPVKVGHDWIASRIVAGTNDGADNLAGTDDDFLIGNGSNTIVSKIASVTIIGQIVGTPAVVSNTDSFRFMAEKIGAFKLSGLVFPLKAGGADNLSVGPTADVHVVDNG